MDFIDDFFGALGGVIGFVLNPLKSVVKWLWSEFIATLNTVIAFVGKVAGDLYNTVWSLYDTAIQWAEDLYNNAVSVASGLVSDLRNWAVNAVNAVTQWATDVLHWAQDAVGVLTSALDGWVNFLWHDLIDPIYQWVATAAGFVANIIGDALSTFYNDTIAPIVAAAEWAWHALSSIWDWLTNDVVAVVRVVELAWDWLVWLGAHALSDIEALWSSGPNIGPRLSQFIDTAHSGAALDELGDYVDKVLS